MDLELDGLQHPELRMNGNIGLKLEISRSCSSDPGCDRLNLREIDAELIGDGVDMTQPVCKAVNFYGANRA